MSIFDASQFIPRGECGNWGESWKEAYIWSQNSIFTAYICIGVILLTSAVSTLRTKLPKTSLTFSERTLCLAVYGAFIFLCGLGHAFDGSLAFIWPAYHFFALWHLATALSSWAAVLVTIKLRLKLVTGF